MIIEIKKRAGQLNNKEGWEEYREASGILKQRTTCQDFISLLVSTFLGWFYFLPLHTSFLHLAVNGAVDTLLRNFLSQIPDFITCQFLPSTKHQNLNIIQPSIGHFITGIPLPLVSNNMFPLYYLRPKWPLLFIFLPTFYSWLFIFPKKMEAFSPALLFSF